MKNPIVTVDICIFFSDSPTSDLKEKEKDLTSFISISIDLLFLLVAAGIAEICQMGLDQKFLLVDWTLLATSALDENL